MTHLPSHPARGAVVPGPNRQRVALTAMLAGLALWLLTRQYHGQRNDAFLYTLMGLNWVDPHRFSSDLFLSYGSQDQFSIFSWLYGPLIGWLGVLRANMGLLLAAHLVWLIGAWLLTHRLLRGVSAHLAFLLACTIQPIYGGWSVLYAGELFLTPRPFSEGLSMIGMAMLLGRAPVRAAAAFVLALLFHPAMALAGIAAAAIAMVLRRRALFWALPLGLVAILGLAAAHVAPLDRLFVIMDHAWLAAVRARNGFVLPTAWAVADWVRVAADLAICAVAALCSAGARRRVFVAVSLTSLAGLAASVVLGDLLHDALIIQLQTWRFCWLLAVTALPALVIIWLRLRRRPFGRWSCLLLASPSVLLSPPFQDYVWVWVPALIMSLTGLFLAIQIRQGRRPGLSPMAARMLIQATAVWITLVVGLGLVVWWLEPRPDHAPITLNLTLQPFRLALLAIGVTLVAMARKYGLAALGVSALCVAGAATVWDQSSPWQKYISSGRPPSPIAAILPPGGAILWGVHAYETWLLLRHPAYISDTQGSGLLFSRATSMEWMRRSALVRPTVQLKDWSHADPPAKCAEAERPISVSTLSATCQRDSRLAGIIVDRPVAGGAVVRFTTPVVKFTPCVRGTHLELRRSSSFSYFACATPPPRPAVSPE